MLQIKTVQLPQAAGINTNGGDVRHFGPSDPVDSEHISQATRNLAYRDTILVNKINELVGAINERLFSIVPQILPAVNLAPGEEIQIGSFRIPEAYEAGLIQAAVTSIPLGMIQLDVDYSSNSFGQATGDSVASVLPGDELTSEGPYYGKGELIFTLTNVGNTTATAIASLILKVRAKLS